MNNTEQQETLWAKEHEDILIDWADKAMCFRWLHGRAHQRYSKINAFFTIPVIILSTLTGTANFAQEKFPPEYRGYIVMGIGGLNIIAGIITTIQQFLKISEKNEAHRVGSISWDKFNRDIKIELAKRPHERMNPINMLKKFKEDYDRLIETSPIIPVIIIQMFKTAFEKTEGYEKIAKPDICDTLKSTNEFAVRIQEITTMLPEPDTSGIELNHSKLRESLQEELQKEMYDNLASTFKKIHARDPYPEEIYDIMNMNDKEMIV